MTATAVGSSTPTWPRITRPLLAGTLDGAIAVRANCWPNSCPDRAHRVGAPPRRQAATSSPLPTTRRRQADAHAVDGAPQNADPGEARRTGPNDTCWTVELGRRRPAPRPSRRVDVPARAHRRGWDSDRCTAQRTHQQRPTPLHDVDHSTPPHRGSRAPTGSSGVATSPAPATIRAIPASGTCMDYTLPAESGAGS